MRTAAYEFRRDKHVTVIVSTNTMACNTYSYPKKHHFDEKSTYPLAKPIIASPEAMHYRDVQ